MMRKGIQFRQRQCVHVGAQADRALAAAKREFGYDAGTGNPAMDFESQAVEVVAHLRRRALFVKGQFGMSVNIAAQRGNLRCQGRQQFVDHDEASVSDWQS